MRYFPVFIDLRDRPALVVGGGTVAARKAESLIAAGATVTVVAPVLVARLEKLGAAGKLHHLRRTFTAADVAGRWLVIAATGSREVNATVSAAATALRVPCNVVDDQELSTCIMPAVIDRGPLQIAVSTGGASPSLARLVRAQLERMLDHSLAAFATFAGRWRVAARERLRDAGARRRFLSALLNSPATAAIRIGRGDAADEHAQRLLDSCDWTEGSVTLVGAGPGDPGLLTLRGLRVLQEADVIVHDRLVSQDVLDLARRDAERIDVGKRPGGAGASQEEINALLVERARQGESVVRLKGGDPFVFGRGGEELDYVRARGIRCDVVPGITAAIAAAACAGIPLTDRRSSRSLRLLTANSEAVLASYDFSDVAGGEETLALYMGMGTLPTLRDRLLASGVAETMPVAFIENASSATQRIIVTTVDDMLRTAGAENVHSPAITLVGRVAANRVPTARVAPVTVRSDAA